MRKRSYAVAGLLGAIGALVIAGPASAAPQSPHGFTLSGNPPKQSKKQFGGITVNAAIDENFTGGALLGQPGCTTAGPGCTFFPPAIRSQFFLPNEWKITPGRLAGNPCTTGQLSSATFSTARSVCSASLVGTGNVVIRNLAGTALFGQVSAFVGGPRLLLIHIDVPQVATKPVLQGNIVGNSTLDVQLQPVAGTVIDDINLNVPKKKVSKKGAKKRKFLIAAKCTDGTWSATQLTTFQDGSTSPGTPTSQRCQKAK
jgi:hypothetical protein